jgi:uncharacterized protein
MDSALGYLLLFAVGLVAGTVNVVAGGGSFLTLPVLIFLGLPPSFANATNRVGILLQNVAAVWSFRRHGYFDRSALVWAGLPSIAGGAVGTWMALWISDRAFQQILAVLMVALTLWTLWSRRDAGPPQDAGEVPQRPAGSPWLLGAGFFAVGIYGGFIQAGVGYLVLAVTSAAGLDLVRGNAVKVLAMLCTTALALPVFAWQGRVDWALGLILAAGNVLGGILGVRLTVLKGHRWVRRVVTVTIVVFAVKLWWSA